VTSFLLPAYDQMLNRPQLWMESVGQCVLQDCKVGRSEDAEGSADGEKG